MNLSPVLVLVLAVLVPTLCVNIEDRRCDLRDQLKSVLSSKNQKEHKLARVICEVEKFASASSMNPTKAPNTTGSPSPTPAPSPSNTQTSTANRHQARGSGSGEDSGEEKKSGKGDPGAYLKDCVVVTNGTNVTVDATCLGKNWVFEKVYLKTGEDCKKISPKDFFQNCSNSDEPDSREPDSRESDSRESTPRQQSKSKSGSKSKHGKKSHH